MNKQKVNCLGILVVDALSGPLRQYPEPGKCPEVITDSIRFLPGGGSANTSAALAQLGLDVSIFSKISSKAADMPVSISSLSGIHTYSCAFIKLPLSVCSTSTAETALFLMSIPSIFLSILCRSVKNHVKCSLAITISSLLSIKLQSVWFRVKNQKILIIGHCT